MTRALRRAPAAFLLILLAAPLLYAQDAGGNGPGPSDPAKAPRREKTVFSLPCDDYAKGLKGRGNFGLLIPGRPGSPFGGTYHLAEDVWLEGGTPVKSVGDGVVVYSDFSETWTDDQGRKHWNLGNVIVIEHPLEPPEKDCGHVCSIYVHLGKDRAVKTGDRVARGQRIGSIGRDRSDENGGYPAHLHFGIHKGPYLQIPPAWRREVSEAAAKNGLPVSAIAPGPGPAPGLPPGGAPFELFKGEVESMERVGETSVKVSFKGSDKVSVLPLLVHSSSPNYRSVPIMCWCCGYGDKRTLEEWLRPSTWIRKRERR